MAYEEIRLNRRDMVRSETEAAIDLLLEHNFVAAHVLTFAARAILRGMAKAKGIETFDDILEAKVKPERVKDWRNALNSAYNIFKHADEDPEKELEKFRPETTVFALSIAIINYGLLYKQKTIKMTLLFGWFVTRYPDLLLPPLDEAAKGWQPLYGNPEGKPLFDALEPLGELVNIAKENGEDVLARLPPEAIKNIER